MSSKIPEWNMYTTRAAFLIFLSTFCTGVPLEDTKYKVIIVGAGASGIAAASRLLENNFHNFVILEAENRTGGRIYSEVLSNPNVYVDLGAEFCEGQIDNIVYDMARKYNILQPTDRSFEIIYSNGSLVNDHGWIAEMLRFKEYLKREYISEREELMSYGEFFLEHFETDVLKKYSFDNDTLRLCLDVLPILEGETLLKEGAFSWKKLALLTDKKICEGNQYLNWKEAGFKKILDIMIKVFPVPSEILRIDDKYHFKKVVSTIEYGGFNDNNITLICEDGSNYTAEYVIFTPSIGVLKERQSRMFIPELPIRQSLCINSLGFESYMKIILEFDRRWWPKHFKGKALLWTAEEKTNLAYMFQEGPVLNGESWLSDIRFIFPVVQAPNLLAVYMTGKFVREVEQAPYGVIENGVMYVIHRFLGREIPGRPLNMWHTDWYTNPNFRGMRSFETLGSASFPFNCNEELGKPLRNMNNKPVVLFAGEATSPEHYGTVHGAIETGYREADRLLRILDNEEKSNYYYRRKYVSYGNRI